MNPIIIETKRLILTGLSPLDMKFVFENLKRDEIMKVLGHQTEEDFQKEKYKYKNGYASYNRTFLLFLLTDKESNYIIGRCGLHNWNIEHHRAEIGYNITDENFKNKGLMTEAVAAIVDYGFCKLKLHRIEALVGMNNIPSLKILGKHNFVKEGLLRKHYNLQGDYVDSVLYSKLESEYFEEMNKKTNI